MAGFSVLGIDRQYRLPTNHSSQKTRLNVLSYGIKIRIDFSSVLSQFTRLTDGQTDGRTDHRILIARRVCILCSAVKSVDYPSYTYCYTSKLPGDLFSRQNMQLFRFPMKSPKDLTTSAACISQAIIEFAARRQNRKLTSVRRLRNSLLIRQTRKIRFLPAMPMPLAAGDTADCCCCIWRAYQPATNPTLNRSRATKTATTTRTHRRRRLQ